MSKNPNLNISVEDIEKMRDIVLSTTSSSRAT
jgi:hypothetical protein